MIRQVGLIALLCVAGVFSRTIGTEESPVDRNWGANWEGFIVGGQNAAAGQFPHVASLRGGQNNHFCGAFIVSNRWVVSAAHCTQGAGAVNSGIIVGALLLSGGGVNVGTERVINHPGYSGISLANDVCTLRTANSITFNANTQPIQLGSAHIGGGAQATAAGWGRVGTNLPLANHLQWLNVQTITNQDCRDRHNAINALRVHDNTICTFTRQGEGMCNGDSGSALFIGNNAIGIVSWGIPCAQGFPDNFARVSSHRQWLLDNMVPA